MICDEVMELMQRHLDGDLNKEEYKRMTAHLTDCPECSDMMVRLEQIDRDLASLPKVEPAYSLVDAILPRLRQIDAAAAEQGAAGWPHGRTGEAAGGDAPRSGTTGGSAGEVRQSAHRPWYARTKWMHVGGWAAAAAVLGVMIVNGLPETFDSSTSRMQSESPTANQAADSSIMMKTEQSGSGGDAQLFSAATGAAGGSEESGMAADAAAEEPMPQVNSAGAATAESAEADERGESEPAPASVPEPPAPGSGGALPAPGGTGAPAGQEDNVDVPGAPPGAPSSGEVSGRETAAPAESPQPTAAEVDVKSAPPPLAQPESVDDPELQRSFGEAAYANPSGMPEFWSEDGQYRAFVERTEDGSQVVKVEAAADRNGFVSGYRWPDGAAVELTGWDGKTLNYTVQTEAGETMAFAIDMEEETELQRALE